MERRKNDPLSKLSQHEWKKLIDKIEDKELRTRIALIIWWDYACEKDHKAVFSIYLGWRERFHKTREDIYEELSKIYPPEIAKKRLWGQ